MAIFKCKMCGGTLEINNETVATCEYCGTQQTLPKLDDDKRVNMYDRANHFRRNNEFDKAMGIYEQILNEDNTDAEAYWSLVLCRYGIEYVEDPASHKRIPTVNRAQFTSIFDDEDYKSALQNADASQKAVYEAEANAINEIQKGILAISQNEEPFDVFICYKESDNNGRRTPDSVLANDLYHQLTQEGFKVFFARITLEDKLGSAYEPYIFAALNSAKVMVVLGTKPEYFNAVWVKNEWSRYLALIKQGQKKMLIPAYKDMDPYDLPEEFSHLQAQDMSKLGFMQDLIRGIKKIAQEDAPKATVIQETVVAAPNANTAPLLKRAFMFLEDGDFARADDFCEQVLNIDPECAQAYLGKLMAELKVKTQEALKDQAEPFHNNSNYQKVLRFADPALAEELKGYVAAIQDRNAKRAEEAQKEARYLKAMDLYKSYDAGKLQIAIQVFTSLSGYRDSDSRIQMCYDKIKKIGQEELERERLERERLERERLAEEQARLERERQAELRRIAREKRAKLYKKIGIIATLIACAIIACIVLWNVVIMPAKKKSDFIAAHGQKMYDKFGIIEEGEYISFGTYEQDNNTSNGKEDVEWLVLEVKDGKILVVSKYALDCKPYNTSLTDVTWDTCTLRKWLNNDFVNTAFSADERVVIPTVTVSAEYNTNPGNAAQDQVFLLSITEVNKYFSFNSARQCKPTNYAVANGAWERNGGFCLWWLRSNGRIQTNAARVFSDGGVDENGYYVNFANYAVRPAMWIDLNAN